MIYSIRISSLIQNLASLTFGQYIKWFPKKVETFYFQGVWRGEYQYIIDYYSIDIKHVLWLHELLTVTLQCDTQQVLFEFRTQVVNSLDLFSDTDVSFKKEAQGERSTFRDEVPWKKLLLWWWWCFSNNNKWKPLKKWNTFFFVFFSPCFFEFGGRENWERRLDVFFWIPAELGVVCFFLMSTLTARVGV